MNEADGPPEWPRTEATATPTWFEAVVGWMEASDEGTIALFQIAQRQAVEIDDELMFAPLGMSDAEHRAVLDGNRRRLGGEPTAEAWSELLSLLVGDNPSAHFRQLVASLVLAGAFHNRGDRGLATDEARARRDYITDILRWAYGKEEKLCQQRAADVIAHEDRKPMETYAQARERVEGTIDRGFGEKTRKRDRVSEIISRALKARP